MSLLDSRRFDRCYDAPVKLDPRFLLLIACFVLSGFAGLIYETVWTQQFAVVFGTSELALSMVLAAYMAGLALGAALAARWASRVRRPILIYAVLELGIGLAALAVPALIEAASWLQVVLLGGTELPAAASTGSALYVLVSSFLILLLPTTMMGATLPLLVRQAVRQPQEIGRRISALYAANTAGAAAGTLVAAFLLMPRIGLGPTVWCAAAVNLAVFLLAAVLARGTPQELVAADRIDGTPTSHSPTNGWILPLILISGAVSFTWEILWTRLLGHILGGSVYAFATMLATFLTGLALGSAAAAKMTSTPERARRGFVAAQLAIAGLSCAAFSTVDHLPALARRLHAADNLFSSGAILSAATLLPGAIAIGATFPLAVRMLARDTHDATRASARVMVWNTLGAITGSLAAGYVLLPALQFATTAAVATAVSLILALSVALVRPRRHILAAMALVGFVMLAAIQPTTPWSILRRGPLSPDEAPGEVVHYGVGQSATVLLLDQRSGWRLTTNGLPESIIDTPWMRPGRTFIAHWLTLLPFAVRPETQSLVVIGLGGGVTAEDVPRAAQEIHVIELEPEVIRANQWAAARRRVDPLADPRLRLTVNDARGALRLTRRSFDAIVSQPSHPWTSGASHLFTREFLQLVRERLTPTGVFVQWMGLPFVDEALLNSFVATAVEVFPHVELYRPGPGAFLLLASPASLEIEQTAARTIADSPHLWSRLGVLCREDILAARVLDSSGSRRFATQGQVSTDVFNLFRNRSPKILGHALQPITADRMLGPYEPLLEVSADIDPLYLVRRLMRQGAAGRASRLAEAQQDPGMRQAAIGLVKLTSRARQAGEQGASEQNAGELAMRQALSRVSDADNSSTVEALHGLLLARYRQPIINGEPVSFTKRFPNDPAAAVIAGWRALGAEAWEELGRLEQRLALVQPRHALFPEATRLRASWRTESGDTAIASQASALLEPLLSPVPRPADLLLLARASAAADEPRKALAALDEVLPRLPRGSKLASEASQILRSLPAEPGVETWRQELRERLRRPMSPRPRS